MNKRRTSLIFFIFSMLFFYLPLVILITFSFNETKALTWSGFSFKWYKELFTESSALWSSFSKSILIAITSSTLSIIIGGLGAFGIYKKGIKLKKYLMLISFLPLILPDLIMGISLLIFFATLKFQLSLLTVFIAHTTFNIPYVFLIILSRLQEFDHSILEASYDLGANERQTFTKVVIPILKPAFIASFLIAMTLSLDDFVITFFVSGAGSSTLPLQIYSMIRFGIAPTVNALSVLLVGITVIFTISSKNIQKYIVN